MVQIYFTILFTTSSARGHWPPLHAAAAIFGEIDAMARRMRWYETSEDVLGARWYESTPQAEWPTEMTTTGDKPTLPK